MNQHEPPNDNDVMMVISMKDDCDNCFQFQRKTKKLKNEKTLKSLKIS